MKQYILIAILGCSIQLNAQTAGRDTVFQRTMTLEKEFSPTIEKASKINSFPEIREPQTPQTQVEFSNFSVPANFSPEASKAEATQYFKDLESSTKRGYVKAGISTFVDVDGDAGYRILNSATDDLSIWATHRSSFGNVKSLQTDEKLKLRLNDNIGALRYAHNFGSSKLFGDAKYTHSQFNYYGGGFPHPDYPNALFSHPNQTNNIFDINVGFLSKDTYLFNFLLGVNFVHFGQKKSLLQSSGLKENTIKTKFDINKDFDKNKIIGLSGYFQGNSYSPPDLWGFDNSYKNYKDLNLNPYFKMEGNNWNVRLGLSAHLLGNQSKNIFYAPDVELSFSPYESGLLYLTAKGGLNNNSNSNIFYENRYVVPDARILDSYTQFDGSAGFKSSFSGVFEIDIYVGYRITEQEHFYLPYGFYFGIIPEDFYSYNNLDDVNTGRHSFISGFYNPIYYDTKVFKLCTNLKYQYSKMLDLSLRAVYYNWNVDKSGGETWNEPAKAWNKPTFESDLTAGFQFPSIPLRTDLAYHLETGRKSDVNMKDINDISLTGTYTINDSFSVFAKVNNLLNQQYDIWYGYPAQGIRLMGGLSVKF